MTVVFNKYNNTPHRSIDDNKPNQADKPENIFKILELNIGIKQKVYTCKSI